MEINKITSQTFYEIFLEVNREKRTVQMFAHDFDHVRKKIREEFPMSEVLCVYPHEYAEVQECH